jgi:hypothetical protein
MTSSIAELAPEEVDLRGDWIVQKDRSVVGDANQQRIKWLTSQKLERIANDSSGWDTLYRDPRDGRLWELTYTRSEMHGGGHVVCMFFHEMRPRPSIHTPPSNQSMKPTASLRYNFCVFVTATSPWLISFSLKP